VAERRGDELSTPDRMRDKKEQPGASTKLFQSPAVSLILTMARDDNSGGIIKG
jgi:hypothetical protein